MASKTPQLDWYTHKMEHHNRAWVWDLQRVSGEISSKRNLVCSRSKAELRRSPLNPFAPECVTTLTQPSQSTSSCPARLAIVDSLRNHSRNILSTLTGDLRSPYCCRKTINPQLITLWLHAVSYSILSADDENHQIQNLWTCGFSVAVRWRDYMFARLKYQNLIEIIKFNVLPS